MNGVMAMGYIFTERILNICINVLIRGSKCNREDVCLVFAVLFFLSVFLGIYFDIIISGSLFFEALNS